MRKISLTIKISIAFDKRFRVTLSAFFIVDFSLLSSEIDNFTFALLY